MHKFVHFHGKPNALGTWNVQLADICKKIPKFLFNYKKKSIEIYFLKNCH